MSLPRGADSSPGGAFPPLCFLRKTRPRSAELRGPSVRGAGRPGCGEGGGRSCGQDPVGCRRRPFLEGCTPAPGPAGCTSQLRVRKEAPGLLKGGREPGQNRPSRGLCRICRKPLWPWRRQPRECRRGPCGERGGPSAGQGSAPPAARDLQAVSPTFPETPASAAPSGKRSPFGDVGGPHPRTGRGVGVTG